MTDSEPNSALSPTWPVRVVWDDEEFPDIAFFGEDLLLRRRAGPSLEIARSLKKYTRLAALPKTSSNLSFLPSFGDRPFLIFPRPQLLCSAGLKFSVDVAVPLFLRLLVEADELSHLLMEWPPTSIARGAYGPVDSAQICTSFRSPTGGDETELVENNEHHPILDLNLAVTHVDAAPRVYPMWARINIKVINTTEEPLEISKIMVPTSSLTLFQQKESPVLVTNRITMRLLGPQEAELVLGDPPGGKKACEPIIGGPLSNDRRPYVFMHAYKTKTGLEHGF